MQTSRSNISVRFARRRVPVDRAEHEPRIREVQARVEVEVPHQVGLVSIVGLVAVARPDAESHRRRDTPIATLDARTAKHVAEILEIDLPVLGQPIRHAPRQRARLAIHTGAVVLAPVRSGDDQYPERTPVRRQRSVRIIGLHRGSVSFNDQS